MRLTSIHAPASLWTCLLFLSLLTASCSSTGPDREEIRVLNGSEEVLFFLAMELEASYRIDPSPQIQLTGEESRLLEPGASVTLGFDEIEGGFILGQDLRLFLYAVSGNQATFREILDFTGEFLESTDFRIEVAGS